MGQEPVDITSTHAVPYKRPIKRIE